jgi:hypothetical protein
MSQRKALPEPVNVFPRPIAYQDKGGRLALGQGAHGVSRRNRTCQLVRESARAINVALSAWLAAHAVR